MSTAIITSSTQKYLLLCVSHNFNNCITIFFTNYSFLFFFKVVLSFFNFSEDLNLFIYLSIYLFIFGCVGSSLRCAELSLRCPSLPVAEHGLQARWPQQLQRAGSAVVTQAPSCSAARGILPDQGSNPCPLHWQADSQPLCHQGSPKLSFLHES